MFRAILSRLLGRRIGARLRGPICGPFFSTVAGPLVLLSIALFAIGIASPAAAAMSPGCAAINANWSAHPPMSGGVDDWLSGYQVKKGEVISYTVRTS